MHYVALVLIDPEADPEAEITRMFAPYDENSVEGGKWDWWQIGGRWTGVLDREYDPAKDPQNAESCFLCEGTGTRKDIQVANGCNGCQGTGNRRKWPTQWARFGGDVKPVKQIDVEWTPFTLVTPDGTWHEQESWVWDPVAESGEIVKNFTDEEWRRFVAKTLAEYRDKVAVVVDYHS